MARKKKVEQKPEEKEKKTTNNVVAFSHGRRKEAVARVRLYKNGGTIVVNDKPIEQYFPGEVAKVNYLKPFEVTKTLDIFGATVKVSGSGKSGQLGAVAHGLANALIVVNPEFKPILRKAGLVTRDPRVKERRKFGLAQKARKAKQSPRR